jgi:hypothetical protein
MVATGTVGLGSKVAAADPAGGDMNSTGREARNCAIVIDDCRTSRASLAWAMVDLGFQVSE